MAMDTNFFENGGMETGMVAACNRCPTNSAGKANPTIPSIQLNYGDSYLLEWLQVIYVNFRQK